MSATLLADHGGASVYRADWRELLEIVRALGGCDCLCVDAPYSDRTHAGHNEGVDQSGRDLYQGKASKRTAACDRKPLSYSSWGVEEVSAFVAAWAPVTRGWICSLTDHVLAPTWMTALEDAGRYPFAPLAVTDIGSRVRLSGDGPSNWSVWLVVARPKTREMQRWGTLPGAYAVEKGDREARHGRTIRGVVGGKPLGLMRRIVRDYTRTGDLIVDPCCGAGTTLLAARLEGRRAIGGDMLAEHAERAAERIRELPTKDRHGTLALFGERR